MTVYWVQGEGLPIRSNFYIEKEATLPILTKLGGQIEKHLGEFCCKFDASSLHYPLDTDFLTEHFPGITCFEGCYLPSLQPVLTKLGRKVDDHSVEVVCEFDSFSLDTVLKFGVSRPWESCSTASQTTQNELFQSTEMFVRVHGSWGYMSHETK